MSLSTSPLPRPLELVSRGVSDHTLTQEVDGTSTTTPQLPSKEPATPATTQTIPHTTFQQLSSSNFHLPPGFLWR